MIRTFALTLVASTVFISCATHDRYEPLKGPEIIEYSHDRTGVYPDDVRQNLDRYTNTPVVWAGVIRSTDANEEDIGGKIWATSIFTHHYYDWKQVERDGKVKLVVSPRGEGFFRTDWHLLKKDPDATAHKAERYAAKGKLALVYGVPKAIDPDGIVVLEYRYLRIFDVDGFTTNEVDYGRMGDPFHPPQPMSKPVPQP
jgi:hypothetical protein